MTAGARAAAGVRFEIWGSVAHLLVGDAAALPEAERELRAVLARIDRACSRFRPDSALSRLNASAAAGGGGRPTVVDPILLAAIEVALAAADRSGGLVDPTVGRALAAIGYDRDLGDVPADDPTPVRPVPAGGWRAVTVDRELGAVTVPPGIALDLGATGKAWAADLAAARLADRFGCPVLVNLGGDLAVAGGTPAGGREGWRVRVTEDHRVTKDHGVTRDHRAGRELPGQVVGIRSGGLATSSRTVRTWRRAGRLVHHLVDPRTGLPALGTWRCVSVAAADCVGANTAATAAMILGAAAPQWLAARALPARLVAADGSVHTVAGWPAAPKGEAA
jgi:thiamine biosynthesis lipoprotein